MNLRKFLLGLCVTVFFISCGSNKKIVKSYKKPIPKSKLVIKDKEAIKPVVKQESRPDLVIVPDKKQIATEVIKSKKPLKKLTEYKQDVTQEYINKYASIAVKEMHAYKIPASITLAQGVLESGSGRSPLALKSNNHFGIKCHKGWKGNSVSHDDDELGECFRKYHHSETSYEDHSKFLTSRSRYASLFKLNLTDYTGWAYGLKKAGYATDVKYPRKLIAIIKKYNLDQYDVVNNSYINNTVHADIINVDKPTTVHMVAKGDTLYSLSKKYNTTVQKIKDINGLVDNILSIDQEILMP